jgi:hypothetical protein
MLVEFAGACNDQFPSADGWTYEGIVACRRVTGLRITEPTAEPARRAAAQVGKADREFA